METIIKQSADGIFLIGDNKFDTTQGKLFINNHEITDIDTFFKVAEENTRLLEQVKKQKEVIDKAKEWINNHIDTFEERNITIYDWNSLSNPKELLDILKEVE